MPSHLKALGIILVLATITFLFAKAPACQAGTTRSDFERRRNLWLALTLIAFVAHNFWVFIGVAAALTYVVAQRDQNKPALYLSLLFAVPMMGSQIPGLGVIQHFFTIHYGRLLALVVLLPAYLYLRRQPGVEPFGRTALDKILLAYLALQCALMFSASTFTNTLRHGVFYSFVDVFLPYYVASRGIRSVREMRDALMAFLVAALVMAAIAVFEMLHHWLLYAALDEALGVTWSYSRYLEREAGVLRAQASMGQPIPLGFTLAVAFGLGLYLRTGVRRAHAWLGSALLAAGLVAALSRGPWIGALAMVVIFAATGPGAGKRLTNVVLLASLVAAAVLLSPAGDTVVRYLPFVGTVEAQNITFRQRLLEIAVGAILQNPFFGAYNYIYSPAFQELKQGAGFIDIVNTYVGIGLSSGLTGLSLFCAFFLVAAWKLFRAIPRTVTGTEDLHVLGRALLATLLGILIIIFTVSSISVIPLIYWTFAGLCAAYARRIVPVSALTGDAAAYGAGTGRPTFAPAVGGRTAS